MIEELNNFYKKFIEANNLPFEPRDKFNLIKKLIHIYKKSKDDKEKVKKLIQFVSEKTNLTIDHIKVKVLVTFRFYLILRT